ncbi:MAG: phosphoglucosamine mutase [Acidimicrobiia bacterium]
MTLEFGTDGIRGLANRELTPELVTALGRVLAHVMGTDQAFVIGRDTRRSGPMIQAALVAGLCAEGAEVELAGVIPTPGVAHLAKVRGAPAAMISASHNPYEDNGIKLFAPGGRKLSAELERQVEAELREMAMDAPEPGPGGAGVGVDRQMQNPIDEYVGHLVGALEGRRLDGLKIVLDCGNGAAFRTAPKIFKELGAEIEVLNAWPDGTNINKDCGSTDTAGLQEAVVASGARAGLAFDGDGDPVLLVDERGAIVDGDQILAICSLDMNEREVLRDQAVVATVMSNLGLRRCLSAHEIEFVEVDVGDRNVVDELERRNLSLGGEQSGHIIFPDHATGGDGALTGAMLLDVVNGTGHSLGLLAGVMQKFPQVLRNVRVRDRGAIEADTIFWEEARQIDQELQPDGRVLVRPSGTEPVVRVMVEAPSVERAELVADRLVDLVERASFDPPLG